MIIYVLYAVIFPTSPILGKSEAIFEEDVWNNFLPFTQIMFNETLCIECTSIALKICAQAIKSLATQNIFSRQNFVLTIFDNNNLLDIRNRIFTMSLTKLPIENRPIYEF